jgi:hypothetical protein
MTRPVASLQAPRLRLVGSACLIALLTAAIAAPVASASNPINSQYSNGVTQIENQVGGGQRSAAGAPSDPGPPNSPIVQGLPFTGLDLVALAAVAIALLSLGLVLRRLAAPPPARH